MFKVSVLKLRGIHEEIKMSALQIHIVTVSLKLNNQHLITVPWGTVNFVSLVSKCFPRLGLVKRCSPKDQSLSYLLYRETKKEKRC